MYAKPLGIQSRKHRQSGMTTVGMMIIGLFVGIIAFAGIRLTPVYLNYMKVVGVVDGIAVEFSCNFRKFRFQKLPGFPQGKLKLYRLSLPFNPDSPDRLQFR